MDLGGMNLKETGNQSSSALQDEVFLLFKMTSFVLIRSMFSNWFGLECLKLLIRFIFYLALATGIIVKTLYLYGESTNEVWISLQLDMLQEENESLIEKVMPI